MKKRLMTVREAILNSLVDTDRTITLMQVSVAELPYSRDDIILEVEKMLDEGLIKLAFPPELNEADFKVVPDGNPNKFWRMHAVKDDFWFEITDNGRTIWENTDWDNIDLGADETEEEF